MFITWKRETYEKGRGREGGQERRRGIGRREVKKEGEKGKKRGPGEREEGRNGERERGEREKENGVHM